jgi:hypothetical protein
MMQQMGYDISIGLSLCDGRGKLAPFEESLSQAQLDALHEDKILKEEKYGLGYEVHMTSIEPIDVTPASPQMEEGHQPTIDTNYNDIILVIRSCLQIQISVSHDLVSTLIRIILSMKNPSCV